MRNWRPFVFLILLGVIVFSWILFQLSYIHASANTRVQHTQNAIRPTVPGKLQLDSRLPAQTFNANSSSNNVNAKFGSRFDFVVPKKWN